MLLYLAGFAARRRITFERPQQYSSSKLPMNAAHVPLPFSCCTGVLPFSGGDALIYGSSIKSEAGLDAVRPLMGVCPQFDVLWGELSGLEHLTIAGHIKGLPWNKVCGFTLSLCCVRGHRGPLAVSCVMQKRQAVSRAALSEMKTLHNYMLLLLLLTASAPQTLRVSKEAADLLPPVHLSHGAKMHCIKTASTAINSQPFLLLWLLLGFCF